MPAFRRVDDVRAGATAIGILVPPGQRTFVILRPKALDWDLLPIDRDDGVVFRNFERDEAASVARQVQRGLQAAAETKQRLQAGVQSVPEGFHVWVRVSGLTWIVCPRIPGAAYRPLLFAERAPAQEAVDRLLSFLHPGENAEQEYYFNTQNFAR